VCPHGCGQGQAQEEQARVQAQVQTHGGRGQHRHDLDCRARQREDAAGAVRVLRGSRGSDIQFGYIGGKHIATAAHGFDQGGLFAVVIQALAQATDLHIQ